MTYFNKDIPGLYRNLKAKIPSLKVKNKNKWIIMLYKIRNKLNNFLETSFNRNLIDRKNDFLAR